MKKSSQLPVSLLSGICAILLSLVLTGYGNKFSHPSINDLIVLDFSVRNNNQDQTSPKFTQYQFDFTNQFEGTAVTKDGLFHPDDVSGVGYTYFDEGTETKSVGEWISHGGYSADVPEVPASLRHFFDPTMPDGARYLNDDANAFLMGTIQKLFTNPEIDGVQWALGTADAPTQIQEHYYTWEHGKRWIKWALEEKNSSRRKELMARAWRALGETLHMIADNGCPAHVRNDAHPSPLWNNNSLFGNPDPYEELIDYYRQKEPGEFSKLANGHPEPTLTEAIQKSKTVKEIAFLLAEFTNKNFFTGETIYGKDKFGQMVSGPAQDLVEPYKSPDLEKMTYLDGFYSNRIGGYNVMQCNQDVLEYDDPALVKLQVPEVDLTCVISQAEALIPNIIEAGVRTMELYFPVLAVNILKVTDDGIIGEIKHTLDEEFREEIFYNGDVQVMIMDKDHKIKSERTVQASAGEWQLGDVTVPEEGFVRAEINFGGIRIQSKEFAAATRKWDQRMVRVIFGYPAEYSVSDGTTWAKRDRREFINGKVKDEYSIDFTDTIPLIWTGNSFECEGSWFLDDFYTKSSKYIKMSGEISASKPYTLSVECMRTDTIWEYSGVDGTFWQSTTYINHEFSFKDIPQKVDTGVDYRVTFYISGKGDPSKYLIKKIFNYRKEERSGDGTSYYLSNIPNDNIGWIITVDLED